MLKVSLTHDFGGFDLDLAFEAPKGVTALFGASGAGKTTVVNAVAGLMRPDRGRVVAEGAVLLDTEAGVMQPPNRRRIGYVFQDARLFPHLDVRANLLFGARYAPREATGPGFDQVVDLLGIGDLLNRQPGALSGGEKARVAIGRALLSKPRFLLMDEPLAALDAPRRAEILPFLERLRDTGLPVLYISHSLPEVTRLADWIVCLDRGRLRSSGPAQAVLSDPTLADLFGGTEAGAVISARIAGREADGLIRAETEAGPVWMAEAPNAPGAQVRLRIHASDVILSREAPTGLSALNILPVVVERIEADAQHRAWVRLSLGREALLARITQRSIAALGLAPGVACHAVLKSVALAREDLGPEH